VYKTTYHKTTVQYEIKIENDTFQDGNLVPRTATP